MSHLHLFKGNDGAICIARAALVYQKETLWRHQNPTFPSDIYRLMQLKIHVMTIKKRIKKKGKAPYSLDWLQK